MGIYKKAEKRIPNGMYCYEKLEHITGTDRLKIINGCPFYHFNEFLGLFECEYLKKFGIPNQKMHDGWWEDLVEYFGSEEKLFEMAPLDLLFDSVKECGVNAD